MGITLKQLTDTVYLIKNYILYKTQKINQISYAQKTVNTELDYFNAVDGQFSENSGVMPLSLFNNITKNMNIINDKYITLKADRTYNIKINTTVNVSIITDTDITIGNGTVVDIIYTPEEDTNIGLNLTESQDSLDIYYFTIHEISRHIVVDPVEHVNETAGIEDTPVGHILSYMGTTAPKHYLVCDGAEYYIVDYPYLAQHIESNFGSVNYFGGDGDATFAVPTLENDSVLYCIKYEPTYFMATVKTATQEEVDLLRQQVALLEQQVSQLSEILDVINKEVV